MMKLKHKKEWDKAAPIVASFRSGAPPESCLDASSAEALVFSLFSNENNAKKKKKKKQVLLTSTSKIAYQAADFAHQNSAQNLSNYAVGVYDKKTDKVELYNINQLFTMEQTIKGFTANVDEHRGEDEKFMDRRRNLVEAFGNKKSKRMAKNFEENKVDVDNVTGASAITSAFKEKVQDTMQKKAIESAKKRAKGDENDSLRETRSLMLPPYNINATSPDEIYDPKKFLSEGDLQALNMKAQEFIQIIETCSIPIFLQETQISGFVGQRLSMLTMPYNAEKIGYIFYTGYLIQLYKGRFPVQNPVELAEKLDIPPIILQNALGLFTDSLALQNGKTKYTQSKFLKDKLLSYILVMAIIVSDYSLELADISPDLKRAESSLATHCRQLGCRIDKVKQGAGTALSKKQNHRALLKVPLSFPSLSRAGR